jgi:diacylglycerol O-acyltransferase / wax synthase
VLAATASMKSTMASDRVRSLLPTDFPSIGVPWLLQGLTRVVGTTPVAERIPPLANLVISNVPGPAMPLYMAGARMITNFPASIVVHGVALNITVQSYGGSLDIGLMACARALPQVSELAAHLGTAFEELKALPAAAGAAAPASPAAHLPRPAPARKRAAPARLRRSA